MVCQNLVREFWENYCYITHFHGFHEMHMYTNWWNRIFWIISIIGGFIFAMVLIVLGCSQYLKDPVVSLVTTDASGSLDVPVLYCPAEWLDKNKFPLYNATETELYYALSFLKLKSIILEESSQKIFARYSQNITFEMETLDSFRELFNMHIRNQTPPSYYSTSARFAINNSANFEWNLELLISMFEMFVEKDFDSMLEFLYKFPNVSVDRLMSLGVYNKTIVMLDKYNESTFNGCFTLKILDELEEADEPNDFLETLQRINCSEQFLADSYPLRRFSDERLWLEMMISDIFDRPYYAVNLRRHSFPKYRSERILETVKLDKQFAKYLTTHNLSSESDIRPLLVEYIEGTNISEFQRLLLDAETNFLKMDEDKFKTFLHKNHFNNPYEFLQAVSIDLNRFVLSMSYIKGRGRWPSGGNITAKKVMTGKGVCIHFHINLTTNSIAESLPLPYTDAISVRTFQQLKKIYVNIIQLQREVNFEDPFFKNPESLLLFGDSVYDLDPNLSNLPHGLEAFDYPTTATIFEIDDRVATTVKLEMENQYLKNRQGSPCHESTNEKEKYTVINCILTCDDYFTQPKFASTNPRTTEGIQKNTFPVWCYFPLHSLPSKLPNPIEYEPCSYFKLVEARNNWHRSKNFTGKITFNGTAVFPWMKNYLADEILEILNHSGIERKTCLESCIKPCKSQRLSVTLSKDDEVSDIFQRIYDVVLTWNQCPPKSDTDYYKDYRSMDPNNPIWAPDLNWIAEQKPNTHRSLIIDALCYFNSSSWSLIELKIDTTSKTYEEIFTYTWDSLFGIVGGQIGLVTGASCLTFIQLIWVLIRTMYHLKGKRGTRTSAGEKQSRVTGQAGIRFP